MEVQIPVAVAAAVVEDDLFRLWLAGTAGKKLN
jgi:hypothetical protein